MSNQPAPFIDKVQQREFKNSKMSICNFKILRKCGTTLLLFLTASCVSISKTSNYDFKSEERLKTSISEILKASRSAEQKLLEKNIGYVLDKNLLIFIDRHFLKANEIVLAHTKEVKNSIAFSIGMRIDPYLEIRKKLIDFTVSINPSLLIIESSTASARTFPSGLVVLTRPLVEAYYYSTEGYNSALLGILIHEIIHIRDGHAIEQWAISDGRNELLVDNIFSVFSKFTMLLPLISVNYDIHYGASFKYGDHLGQLSEYAADLGTISLLAKNQFDYNDYFTFLSDVHRHTSMKNDENTEPFSWLNNRVGCLKYFSTLDFNEELPNIYIGNLEDVDGFVSFVNTDIKKMLLNLDNPDKLRPLIRDNNKYSDHDIKELVAIYIQKHMFTVCALKNVFSLNQSEGILKTPDFDWDIFSLYF